MLNVDPLRRLYIINSFFAGTAMNARSPCGRKMIASLAGGQIEVIRHHIWSEEIVEKIEHKHIGYVK